MKILGDWEFEVSGNEGIKDLAEDIIVAILCHILWYLPTILVGTYFMVTAPDAGYRAFACLIIIAAYTINHIALNELYKDKWNH